MKVVLFCGGQGQRIRDDAPLGIRLQRATDAPKPMQLVGGKPMLWHVMQWYAHHGHRDFIVCLGYRAEVVREWLLNYADAVELDDEVSEPGVLRVRLFGQDVDGWTVAFADTGLDANIGQRLRAARPLLAGEDLFLANYGDCFSDVPLPDMIEDARHSGAVATFLAVRPVASFHLVQFAPHTHEVLDITPFTETNEWINGGYFVLRQEIFDQLGPGEELVVEPFQRLAAQRRLVAYPYTGFWTAMDTAKDRHRLDSEWASGRRPWAVWENDTAAATATAAG